MIGQVEIPRVMLHARTLGFTHPATGNVEDFTRSAPSDMEQVMRALEQFIIPERKQSRGPVSDMYIAEDAC
jgi:23S rRNA pseudouridine1911/1915/1917 synthase